MATFLSSNKMNIQISPQAVQAGIISGYADGTFGPAKELNGQKWLL
jgi:hypothetical protein